MPVVQFDFCYFKAAGEPTTTAILTGIDAETGMVMATVVGDKHKTFNTMPNAANHPSLSAAEYKQYSTALYYSQTKKIT